MAITLKKIQKITFWVSLMAIVLGANVTHKYGSILLLLGVTTSSSYLLISPKPWNTAKNRRRKYRENISRFYKLRSRYEELVKTNKLSDSVEELREKNIQLKLTRSRLEDDCESLEQFSIELKTEAEARAKTKYQDTITNLEREKQRLVAEVRELKELGDSVIADIERDARVEAASIKQAAEEEAQQIIKATKESLQNTVLEPERNSHLLLLQEINQKRIDATAELERLLGLQEKTRIAIEQMKQEANKAYAAKKEKIFKEAKQQYLKDIEKFNQVIEQLENQLKKVLTENQILRAEIESYDEPQYPEGYREHEVYARGIIDYYKTVGIKLDYKLSFKEEDRIVVRVSPREEKVGEKQLRSFHDRLQRKFDLAQLPTITTTAGCIQFELKLIELQTPVVELIAPPVSPSPHLPISPTPAIHPELISHEEMRSRLEESHQKQFVPPSTRFSPFEPLTQTERDWVLYLYNIVKITDQNTIMGIVWRNTRGKRVSQGVGKSYIKAKEKLHKILDDAEIPRRNKNAN